MLAVVRKETHQRAWQSASIAKYAMEDPPAPVGERPLKKPKLSEPCGKCGKVLSNAFNMKTHIAAVHDELKPFRCNTCNKVFALAGNLKQHIDSIHLELRPFKCGSCDKSFATSYHSRRHVDSVHLGSVHRGGLLALICLCFRRSLLAIIGLCFHISS